MSLKRASQLIVGSRCTEGSLNESLAGVMLMAAVVAGTGGAPTPWETYLALPSAENAAKVERIEYSSGEPAPVGYRALDLQILRLQVVAGDIEAFRLAYRLRERSDAGLLEELTGILARAIRPQPDMFLEAVSSLRPSRAALESILMMPGLEYVDRPRAQGFEIAMRRKAIEGVQVPRLRGAQERCLELLPGGGI